MIEILSSPSESHNKLITTSLSTIPFKMDKLSSAAHTINDAIRLLRHHDTHPMKIVDIKIGNNEFDDSQPSHEDKYSVD